MDRPYKYHFIKGNYWIDKRFEAKLRLYNYIMYFKKGIEQPVFKPFESEIGKTKPILNF